MNETREPTQEGPSFEISSLDFSESEYRDYCRLILRRRRRRFGRYYGWSVFAIGLPVAFAAAIIATVSRVVSDRNASLIAVLALVAYLLGFWAHRRFTWRHFWRSAGLYYRESEASERATRLLIDASGIVAVAPDHSGHWRWSSVRDVQAAAGFVLFWTSASRDPVVFLERWLGSTERRDRLLDFARKQIAANKPRSTS
jgi:hypothetical protein